MSSSCSKLRGEAYIVLESMRKVMVTFFSLFSILMCWAATLRHEHFLIN